LGLPVTTIRSKLRVSIAARERTRTRASITQAQRSTSAAARRENQIFQAWRNATEEEKLDRENQLYDVVRQHASRLIWRRLNENNPLLANDIASTVFSQLSTFESRSAFSTWVHRIATNKINGELRNRTTERSRFPERTARPHGEEDGEEDSIEDDVADKRAVAA